MSTQSQTSSYFANDLGDDFEQLTFSQPDDYEGKVVCTLIRKKIKASLNNKKKAVLYIHGFNDYFFQTEMAQKFEDSGFAFYAMDLRKYGRSYLNHQKMNNVRNLSEYYADIDKALEQIKLEGFTFVLLSGHSTGGLITSVYANDNPNNKLFHALYLNSPFFDFNISYLERKMGIPLIASLGKKHPNKIMKGKVSLLYGFSLYKGDKGEWDYNLSWKSHTPPFINFGFIRAIYLAQEKVHTGLKLLVPTLVMHSNNSIYDKKWSDKFFKGDAILNYTHIKKYAEKIEGNVMIETIDNGMHDLILSPKPVREKVYTSIFTWLNKLQ